MEPTRLDSAMAAIAAQPRVAALVLLLVCAAVVDARTHRIPNVLTAAGALTGMALAVFHVGTGPDWTAALAGFGVGLVLMLPPYAVRTMGAGDVKLMAAAGTFLGIAGSAYAVLATFIAGGLLALAWTAWHRNLAQLGTTLPLAVAASLQGQRAVASVGRMPYAIAICLGTLGSMWLGRTFS
jgi:prepilin peptidase CpaA